MTSLISVADFRKLAKEKRKPDGGVFRLSTLPSVAVEGAGRTRRFCFSDGTVDRMGDTIAADGWDTADFLNNPVALWAHDSSAPPIGTASNLAVENGRLMGDITFIPADIYPFAETVFQMVSGNFLRAVSVGFIPIEYSFIENDPDRGWGIDFIRQTLLEISICPVPANPNALAEARAKGIDTRPVVAWAERLLDGAGRRPAQRSQLSALRRHAKEPRTMLRPRLRDADPSMSGTDPSSGGAAVGNCGRPADKDCGMVNPAECAIHGFGGAGAGTGDDGEKSVRAAVRQAVRSEMRRLRGGSGRRSRRRDADGGEGGNELPEGHEDLIRTAAACFRSAEDYYDSGDDHHDEGMNLMDEASKDIDAADGPSPDHAETVRTAMVRFKSAEALYDLGDQQHDKGMEALGQAVKALDGEGDAPAPGTERPPEDAEKIRRALARVQAARAAR